LGFRGIRIRTVFSKDLSQWSVGSDVRIRTVFSGDYSSWEIKDNSTTIRVRTTFNDDYERWEISGDANGTIRTVFSDNTERWEIDIEEELSDELVAAIVFIPILVATHL
jgi:hypothetical protein